MAVASHRAPLYTLQKESPIILSPVGKLTPMFYENKVLYCHLLGTSQSTFTRLQSKWEWYHCPPSKASCPGHNLPDHARQSWVQSQDPSLPIIPLCLHGFLCPKRVL